jgi:hypothetical protein
VPILSLWEISIPLARV